MKKVFQLFSIVLVFTVLAGCGKQDFTQIEGQVLEKGSNKGVAGAKVIFSECVAGDGVFASAVCLDVETVITDAQGKFVFTKESDKADRYRIRAGKDNYGKPIEVFQTANAGEKTKNINFTLPASAWIKFHVKNVNPFNEEDLIIAPGSSGLSGPYFLYGKNIDTTYMVGGGLYLGNFKNNITWTIERQFKRKGFSDSIFCKALDTVFYEIKY